MKFRLPVFLRKIAIDLPITPDGDVGGFVGLFFYFGGNAHHDGVGRHYLALHDDSTRAHDTILSDLCAIEDRGMHADDAVFPNRGSVNDRAVSDRYVVFDGRGKSKIDMDDRIILYITVLSDRDGSHIRAQDGAEPDSAVFADGHITDKGSGVGNKDAVVNLGSLAIG